MIAIILEIIRFFPKFAKIFEKKKPKKKKLGFVWLVIAAIVGAMIAVLAICFIPSIIKVNGKNGCDVYGHLSHLKIRKEQQENGKTKTKVQYDPIDLGRYAADEV